jgi:mRNA interferase RelE/StbE
MYEIFLSGEAKRQLARLDSKTRERIGAVFERIRVRPHKFVKRLYNSKYYRLRIDDYRVILDIKDMELLIYIIEIGHRSEIYK